MIQELKELLLRDLCARYPYVVKVECNNNLYRFVGIQSFNIVTLVNDDENNAFTTAGIKYIKPYLFPLSSMSEEQKEELITITNGKFRYMCGDITNAIPRKNSGEWGISENAYIHDIKVINILYIWLLKNHFDINGLIPMGLAIDATGLNIY